MTVYAWSCSASPALVVGRNGCSYTVGHVCSGQSAVVRKWSPSLLVADAEEQLASKAGLRAGFSKKVLSLLPVSGNLHS